MKRKNSIKDIIINFAINHKWSVLFVTGIVIAVIWGLFVVSSKQKSNDLTPKPQIKAEEDGKKEVLNQVNDAFSRLQKQFPNQTKAFWRVSSAAIKSLLAVDDPKHPAVILLAAEKRTKQVMDCLAKKMSEAVNQLLVGDKIPVAEFDCLPHERLDAEEAKLASEEAKLALNAKLSEAFSSGARVGLVLAVDLLPGNSSLIFYRLCDTANAPFRHVVIILTLNLKEKPVSDEETHARKELTDLWTPFMEKDQIDPIFSRIGNSVAYVEDETDLSICSNAN